MKTFSTLPIFLIFFVAFSYAQNENYDALNGPYGGGIQKIIASEGRLIGSVIGQGIVISDDGGATWTESNSGINDYYIYALERDPDSNGKLYALASYRLFSSSDNGETWIVVATSGFANGRLIKRSSTGNLFIASSNGTIYRSTDGGTTWPSSASSTLPGNPYIRDFKIGSTGYLFAISDGGGVFRSNSPNSTVGFTQFGAAQGLSNNRCYSLAIAGADIYVSTYAGPFKSSDNGATWVSIKANINDVYFAYPEPLIAESGGSLFLQNGYSRKLWKSVNGGTNWTELSYPMNNYGNEYSGSLSFFAESASTLYSSFQFGTFKSTDGGLNWVEVNNGITGYDPNHGDPIVMADNGRLFYTPNSYFGCYMSVDDGATWELLYNAPMDRQINGLRKIGSAIYGFGGGLIKTVNNGDLWTEVLSETASILGCSPNFSFFGNSGANNFYSISTYNCSTGSSESNLLTSSDAGVTWSPTLMTGLPPEGTFNFVSDKGLTIDASGNGFAQVYNYSLNRYQIYKINLATGAATDISPAGHVLSNAYEYFNGKLYVGVTGNQFLTSTDAGLNWTARSMPTSYGRLKAIDDNTIYLLAANAYLSTDGGDTWVDTGSFGYNRHPTGVIISPANYSYLSLRHGSVQKSTALVIPPAAPTNLSVSGYSASAVGLKWDDNATNEQYHIIERSEGNNTSYDSVGRSLVNSQNYIIFTTSVPNDNTTYYFRVRAVGPAGNSSYSNEVSFTTVPDCDLFTIPVNRSWTATTQNESGAGEFTHAAVAINGSSGTYQITNLTAGATTGITPAISEPVFFVFQEDCGNVFPTSSFPVYANGNGAWDAGTNTLTVRWQTRPNYSPYMAETTVFTLNATDPAPGVPANLGGYIKTPNEIVITWSQGQFAQDYQVQRSTVSGSGFVDIGEPISGASRLLYIDNSSFSIGTTYYYRVVATSLGGLSTTSAEFSIQFQTPLFEAISLPDFDYSTQGISWADIDNDGDDDLLVAPFNVPNGSIGVFENMGDGTFQNILLPGVSDYSGFTGLDATSLRTISVGDINNDGLIDFLTLGPSTGGDLFINRGNKDFERKAITPPDYSGLAWYGQLVDINNDGRLDVTISQYNMGVSPQTTYMRMFTQNADGEFEPYELGEIAADATISYGGSWTDYDNDGDQDFLRSQYLNEFDQLYNNNGDGTFTPVTGTAFEADGTLGSRSMSWGDFDNDLDLDVYVVNTRGAQYSMLYQNNGDGTFTRLTTSLLSETQANQSFGSAWGDIDNDGDLDMIVANNSQSILYLNDGAGNFTRHEGAEYLVAYDVSRTSIAFALSDYDDNGTLDIATGKNAPDFPTILLRNNLEPDANTQWLKVKLKGTDSNQSGIGAHIAIETPDGKRQMRAITSLTGYGSSGSLVAHFGLKDQSTVSSIRVNWPSGATQTLTNKTSNQTIEIIEDGTGPQPTLLLPANSATDIQTTSAIEITLNEPSEAIAGKNIKIVLASDPSTVVFTADVTTGTRTEEKYSFSIPAKLHVATEYHVIVDEGAFEDVWENPSPAITGADWSFTTDPGPVVTIFSPLPDATVVPINANLEMTFDQAVTLVDGKRIRVMDGASEFLNVNITSGTLTGMKYTLTPATDFPGEKLLEIIVDRGAFLDADMNEFAGTAAGQWTFTTSETTKPVLIADPGPLALLNKGFSPVAFNVTATDNVEVTDVNFHYRKAGSKDFTTVDMQKVTGNLELWSLLVTNAFADDMGFEFYIEALDPGGNSARSPESASEYHQSRTRFAENNSPVISVPGEGTTLSWKIIAIPHDIGSSTPQISQVFEDMGEAKPTTWRLITYTNQPQEKWLEYPEFFTLQRGKGYFINANGSKNIALENAASPPFSRNDLFELPLVQGWNQIGNPYTLPINWEDIRDYNGAQAVVGGLKLYTNGAYVNATELLPMQGGFVLAQNAVTLQVSFPGQTIAGGRRQSAEKVGFDLSEDRWVVPLTLIQGDLVNEFGGVGMHPEASDDFDPFDDVNAPTFLDYLEMRFDHPEHFVKHFARDVVSSREEHIWNFDVAGNRADEILLQWNNTAFGNSDHELFLVDETCQRIVDMREQSEYSFIPGISSDFRIYYGKDVQKKIMPSGISLGTPYPNPSDGRVSIPYTIADHISAARVHLEIYDLMGRKIATLVNGQASSGFHTGVWDSPTSDIPNGVYTCKLLVVSENIRHSLSEKIIIKR